MFPSMTKQNMRYRGPMESEKMNQFSSAEVYDALQIANQLQIVAGKITILQGCIFSGNADYSTIGLSDLSTKLDRQAAQLKQIKEVL